MTEQELRDEIARLREELALVLPPFSRRLRIARKALNLSQTQFAVKIGISRNMFSRYENGAHEPNLSTLIKIADELHVSLDWLCGRVNENTFDEEAHHETD